MLMFSFLLLFFSSVAAAQDGLPLPSVPDTGPGVAVGLLLLAALVGGVALWLGRHRAKLSSVGWLPDLLGVSAVLARSVGALAVLGAVAALVPAHLVPALPWVLLAAAVAIGWSVQAFLPDLLAGAALRIGGQVRPGGWVQVGPHAGEVVAVGLFGTELRATAGRLVLPNRQLMSQPRHSPADQRPVAQVSVAVPRPAREARRILRELAMTSPWAAPGAEPDISRAADTPECWLVRAAVLEPHHIARFESAFREHLERLEATLPPTDHRGDAP